MQKNHPKALRKPFYPPHPQPQQLSWVPMAEEGLQGAQLIVCPRANLPAASSPGAAQPWAAGAAGRWWGGTEGPPGWLGRGLVACLGVRIPGPACCQLHLLQLQ